MPRDGRRDLPRGIAPRLRTQNGKRVPDFTRDGTPVYRVRLWDPVLKRRVERTAEGLDAAERLLAEFGEAKRRPGRLQADHARFADVAARYLIAYKASNCKPTVHIETIRRQIIQVKMEIRKVATWSPGAPGTEALGRFPR